MDNIWKVAGIGENLIMFGVLNTSRLKGIPAVCAKAPVLTKHALAIFSSTATKHCSQELKTCLIFKCG